MALNFDDRGLLPIGIHDATMSEVNELLARCQRSDRRIVLFKKLTAYLAELRKTNWACRVIINGSFVMPLVDEPNDIDIILVLPVNWDSAAEIGPMHYRLVNRKATRSEYEIDVYAVVAGSLAEQKFLELFQQVRIEWCRQFGWPTDSRKGLVRVIL